MPHSLGRSSGLTEKLEHSTLVDLLSIGVYAYFGYVSYQNLDYNQSVSSISTDPTVMAVQLATVLIVLNLVFMLHDRVTG